ncbi:glycoside hydrolase family 20 [Prolixibacteraceae bacterium JC049]|nr:glycoside hydrolase family 20 [Prolixibacteraceae bacterium JC049]
MLVFQVSLFAQQVSVIPQPQKVEVSNGSFTLDAKTRIVTDKASKSNAKFLQEILSPALQLKIKSKGQSGIILQQDNQLLKELGEEGYTLNSNSKGIIIQAATQAGVFYGIQTLCQLLPLELSPSSELTVQAVSIKDRPRFSWRAYMLDESRYFQGKAFVKKMLDQMALLKMNVFHWHLTDDAGWRIEIKKYPKLTKVGAFRKDSQVGPKKWNSELLAGEPHGGFYTQKEIKEIIDYATARNITIVPEIEMPGHASAAIAAYSWLGTVGKLTEVPIKFGKLPDSYNVTDPRVYQFIEDVLTEVMELFPGKTIHIGGDEVMFDAWKESERVQQFMKKKGLKSPADLQVFFTNKVSNFIDKNQHRMMGWNEILGSNVHEWQKDSDYQVKEKLANSAIIHLWKGSLDLVKEAVTGGYDIVNSHHVNTYLDYPYSYTPIEKAYAFDPIPEGLQKQYHAKVLGSGCQMWTEWTPTNKDVERQTFPRLAAYAEVGWTNKDRKNYKAFRENLNPILKYWKTIDINYSTNFEKKKK